MRVRVGLDVLGGLVEGVFVHEVEIQKFDTSHPDILVRNGHASE